MKTVPRALAWRGAAVLLALAALLSVADGWRRLREARPRLARRGAELAALRSLQAELDRHRAARAAYERHAAERAPALEPLLAARFARRPDQRPETREEAAPGWSWRRQELVFADVPFADLMAFVAAAEELRPPWRLTRCSLRAASPQGGSGQAAITLETLERNP